MRKTCNGVVYDTDESELIWEIVNIDGPLAFQVRTKLYKTKDGRFFVVNNSPQQGSIEFITCGYQQPRLCA